MWSPALAATSTAMDTMDASSAELLQQSLNSITDKLEKLSNETAQQLAQMSRAITAWHGIPVSQAAYVTQTPVTDDVAGVVATAQVQHRHQRARISADQTPVLGRNEVLDTVFGFVGAGDYYYVAGVCRNWRGRYMQLCRQATQDKNIRFNTSRKRTVVTAARLQLALDNGLAIDKLAHDESGLARVIAAKSLDAIAVLTLARVYGVQWSTHLTKYAAEHEQYELLHWLLKCGCPFKKCEIDECAFRADLEHLKQLYEIFGPWSANLLKSLWCCAAASNKLDTIKWLREQGAQWPKSFFNDSGNTPWGFCRACMPCPYNQHLLLYCNKASCICLASFCTHQLHSCNHQYQ
jgi:hypothetical protein